MDRPVYFSDLKYAVTVRAEELAALDGIDAESAPFDVLAPYMERASKDVREAFSSR